MARRTTMIDMDGKTVQFHQLEVGSLVTWDENGASTQWSQEDWRHLYPEGTFGMLMKIDFDNTHPYTVRWFFSDDKRNRTSQMAAWTLRAYEGV